MREKSFCEKKIMKLGYASEIYFFISYQGFDTSYNFSPILILHMRYKTLRKIVKNICPMKPL